MRRLHFPQMLLLCLVLQFVHMRGTRPKEAPLPEIKNSAQARSAGS